MVNQMISLIYVSTAVRLLAEEELVDILRISRNKNEAADITGMLLYKGGNFMQVLEGPEEKVMALLERIKQDPRHKDVFILSKEPIQMRQFPEWEMAFLNLDDPAVKKEPGFSEFLKDEFTADTFRKSPQRAYIMLVTFKENMR